jgi:hypothetical protein
MSITPLIPRQPVPRIDTQPRQRRDMKLVALARGEVDNI